MLSTCKIGLLSPLLLLKQWHNEKKNLPITCFIDAPMHLLKACSLTWVVAYNACYDYLYTHLLLPPFEWFDEVFGLHNHLVMVMSMREKGHEKERKKRNRAPLWQWLALLPSYFSFLCFVFSQHSKVKAFLGFNSQGSDK